MTIVSTDDICDGQPHIDGSSVSVIEIYDAFARDGMEPAEIADEYEVTLPRIHEALAYYYDHAQRMRQYRDDDSDESQDKHPRYHGLETATSDYENWEETTPTDAGEALFGGNDGDVNERAESEWVDETIPAERVRSVLHHTYDPQSASTVADRARTSENMAGKHVRNLVSEGFAVETADPSSNETLYKRSEESLVMEEANRIRREVDDATLMARVSEMKEKLRIYREEYGAESPEDAVLSDADIDSEELQAWQTTRRNLSFAKVALAISNAKKDLIEGGKPPMSDDEADLEDAHVRSNTVRPWRWSLLRWLQRRRSNQDSEE